MICLFGIGLALGCDYPTAHMIISESIPSTSRGGCARRFRLPGGRRAWRHRGRLSRALDTARNQRLALDVRLGDHSGGARHDRPLYIVESANWLSARGEIDKAEQAAKKLLVRKPQYPAENQACAARCQALRVSIQADLCSLFNKTNRRATILASVPWFLQDLGTYGIGIFTPTILAAAVGANSDHARSIVDLICQRHHGRQGRRPDHDAADRRHHLRRLLADTVGRIALQILGFIGCAAGLLLASLSSNFTGGTQTLLIFAGFMLFNFMTNLGPNAQTYLLAGEVFPHGDPRQGRRLCRGLCQDRRRCDRIPVSHPARCDRHAGPALRPDRGLDLGRSGHLAVPDRDRPA